MNRSLVICVVVLLLLSACGRRNDRRAFLETAIIQFVGKDLNKENNEVIDSVHIISIDSLNEKSCLVLASPAVRGTTDNVRLQMVRRPHKYVVTSDGNVKYP